MRCLRGCGGWQCGAGGCSWWVWLAWRWPSCSGPQTRPGPGRSGSVEYYLGYYWKRLGKGLDESEFGNNTVMLTAMNESRAENGIGRYVVYILVGTIDEVKAHARALWSNRSNVEW